MDQGYPEVSVVIPCYNGERFVAETIESVLAQTYSPIEIVVVDDGSTDGSIGVVDKYASRGDVVFVRHDTNRGIAAARNTGIRTARGRYIAFLDHDDLWREDKIARQLPIFKNDTAGETGVVFSDVGLLVEDSAGPARSTVHIPAGIEHLKTDELLSLLLTNNVVVMISALVRRECFDDVGYIDESIRSGSDDFDFFIRAAERYRFACIHEKLAVRRMHEGNYSNAELLVPDALRIIDRTVANRPALSRVASRARSRQYFGLARYLHSRKAYARAKHAYINALRERPTNLKSFAGLVLCLLGSVGDVLFSAVRRRPGRR